jgi:hypothetical protein
MGFNPVVATARKEYLRQYYLNNKDKWLDQSRKRGHKPRATHIGRPAICHPDKRNHSRGQCINCYHKAYYRTDKERNRKLIQMYGITAEQRNELFAQNGGRCMICNTSISTCVDHDHSTGTIRGALCRHCNSGLGHFQDNTSFLKSAIEYLTN